MQYSEPNITKRTTSLMPWLVWLVSSLFVTYQMLLQTSPSVMIADLEAAFSINTLGVSLLTTSFFYTYVILQIPAGMLVDRIQPRYCLSFCLLGIAILTLVFAYAESLGLARASRILQGVFSAPSVTPALYLAAMWFPAKRFALITGLTEMVGMLGSALGQAALAPCASYYGWRFTLVICAGIGLALAVLTFLIVRDKPNEKKTTSPSTNRISVLKSLQLVVASPQAWINGLFSGLLFAVSAAFASFWCIPFLMEAYQVSLTTAAALSSMTLFGVAMGAPVLGAWSDRVGLRCQPMLVSTVIVLILMTMIIYVHLPLAWMCVALYFLGFFSSAYALPFAVMRDITPPEVRGTAMGYTNMMCILIGAPILQPLIGWWLTRALNHSHSHLAAYQHALSLLPICLLLALILVFFVEETHCGNAYSEEASLRTSSK